MSDGQVVVGGLVLCIAAAAALSLVWAWAEGRARR